MSAKKLTVEDDDRISSLPDDVCCHVLSLLPTKHAVGTTILSARWKHLFASLTDFDFDDCLLDSETNFLLFVMRVIDVLLIKSTQIRKFRVNCKGGRLTAPFIYLWICVALRGNLQSLYVCLRSLIINPVSLPPEIFDCKTLTELQLRGKFSLSVPDYVSFPNLKTLALFHMILTDDESIKRFFHGCLVLERLMLLGCVVDNIRVMEVSVATLISLDLWGMHGDYELVLDTPILESFDCNSYAARGYSGNRLNSLNRACVELGLEGMQHGDEVCQLINMISNARSLTFGGDSLQFFVYELANFHNLTNLMVNTRHVSGWLSLPYLLEHAPWIQVLSFHDGLYDDDGNFEMAHYLSEEVPACVSTQLKEVEVKSFCGEEVEYQMVEYFLNNAKVLEKMTITPNPDYISNYFQVTKRLLELPRCSRACVVVFNDVDV